MNFPVNSWVEINISQLEENIKKVKENLSAATELIFVVKSNAYGHSLFPVIQCAEKVGIRYYAVAHIDEALEVRKYTGSASEIIILGSVMEEEIEAAIASGLIITLFDIESARMISWKANEIGKKARCHVKFDTGMGRLGFRWDSSSSILESLWKLSGIKIEGICSHFATAEVEYCSEQYVKFLHLIEKLKEFKINSGLRHISNSAGFAISSKWDMDAVRIGILLYGYKNVSCDIKPEREIDTRPVLSWKTKLIHMKEIYPGESVGYDRTFVASNRMKIGIINVGYGDGYSRMLSNKGLVLIGGIRHRIVGRVSMNVTAVELFPDINYSIGQEVVLIGQQGREYIWADEIASIAGTIPYEVLTSIKTRDIRIIRNE